MQSSSLAFNTKPILASLPPNNSKENCNCTLFAAKFSRLQPEKSITLHPQTALRNRASPVSIKNTHRRLSSKFNELRPRSRLLDNSHQVSCFHSFKRKQIGLNRFTSGFFIDKSSFRLQKNLLDNAKVRKVQVSRASVGPEEPHAASTAWPDGVTEKPGLDLLDSEAERIEFENFLRFELPSHPKLHRGQLKNGLRYLILPNKVPPNRPGPHFVGHETVKDEENHGGKMSQVERVKLDSMRSHELQTGHATQYEHSAERY